MTCESDLLMSHGKATDRCMCPTCCAVFASVRSFDKHLTPGRLADGFDGEWCRPPASIGLVQDEIGVWHLPGRDPRGDAGATVGSTQGGGMA